MRTIDDQLREYARYADEALPWVNPMDVMEAVKMHGATIQPLPARNRSNVFAIVAAAVGTLLIVGGVAWLLGGGATTESADGPEVTPPLESVAEPTTITESPTTTSTPTSVPEASTQVVVGDGWIRRDLEPAADAFMEDVIAVDSGYLAVGFERTVQDDGSLVLSGVVWEFDGTDWSRLPADASLSGTQLIDAATGPVGTVAVGIMWSELDEGIPAWLREGDAWIRAEVEDPITGGATLLGVTAGGPGFVAVGMANTVNLEFAEAAIWTSVDGKQWTRVPHDDELFSMAQISDVTVGGSGLVAVGVEGLDEGSPGFGAAVWTSADGLEWTRVRDQEFLGAGFRAVSIGGPGLIAVGDVRGAPAIWTSTDGLVWDRIPHNTDLFGTRGIITHIAATNDQIWALGRTDLASADNRDYDVYTMWTSLDGLVWTISSLNDPTFNNGSRFDLVGAIAPHPDGILAVGGVRGPAVWTYSQQDR